MLQSVIIKSHDNNFPLRKVVGSDKQEKYPLRVIYLALVVLFLNTWFGIAFYVFVVIMWLIPDKQIEENL